MRAEMSTKEPLPGNSSLQDFSAKAALRFRTFASFEELPDSYRPLFEDCASHSFYYSLPWFRNLVRAGIDADERVRIFGLESSQGGGVPVAVLPARHKPGSEDWLQGRVLHGLSNHYSSLFGPLLGSAASPKDALPELVRGVCSDTPRWDVVSLNYLDRDSPVFAVLVDCFQSAEMVTQTYFSFGNWYLPVNGRSFREYCESLPSVVQNTIKRKTKKLERDAQARIEIVTGGSGLDAAIQAYEAVYLKSWKVPEPYPNFMPGLIRTCAEQGWLRLGIIYIGEQPAAAQLWIVQGGTASIYKLAYDERFSQYSAGTVLTARLMEHALDVDKVLEIDYLTGDDGYKKDWMSHRRERWGILAMNPKTASGNLAIIRHLGGRFLKRTIGKWMRRAPKPQEAVPSAAAASPQPEGRDE
jgi:hypothetical protein